MGFTICGSYIEQVWPPLAYMLMGTYLWVQGRIKGGATGEISPVALRSKGAPRGDIYLF